MTEKTLVPAAPCASVSPRGEPGDPGALRLEARQTFQRKDAILAAACDLFGRYGFRGASLRDIARDAGVSLTLLNHHFDNKAGLLSAVMAEQGPLLRRRAAELRRLRSDGLGVFEPVDLVRAWITGVFEAASSRDGRRFLRLLARLGDDGAEEAVAVRGSLDEGADAFVDALLHCYPHASRRAATSAYLCVNASLLALVTNADRMQEAAEPSQPDISIADSARLERFLLAGIEATLSRPETRPDEAEKGWMRRTTLSPS